MDSGEWGERMVVPAGAARAVRVNEGRRVRVVNSEGGQVVDTWAFCASDPSEHLSMAHSRSATYRIYFRVGDVLVTNRFRPILRIAEDTSPGRHDTLHAACNAGSNKFFGAPSPTPNCEDNLKSVLAELGIHHVAVPCPWNLYEHADVDAEGALRDRPASARAGDYVELACLTDLILVCSACPSRIGAISGADRAPRGAEIVVVQAAVSPEIPLRPSTGAGGGRSLVAGRPDTGIGSLRSGRSEQGAA